MSGRTRRSIPKVAGASLATTAVTAAGTAAAETDGWTVAETPVDDTLHDVAYAATNAHAAGDGGVPFERTDAGWETVLRGGPTGDGNDL